MIDFLYRKPNSLKPIDRGNITQIAIHHTGAENTIEQDTDYQMDNAPDKFSWLAYGFYLDLDGTVYKVRGVDYENAGVYGENHRTVSIALRGNFNNRIPNDLQLDALEGVILEIKGQCDIQVVDWHKKWSKTSCAGSQFPIERFRWNMLKNDILKIGDEGILVRKLQEKLVELGYKIAVDGDFGNDTNTAVEHFQVNNSLEIDGIVGANTEKALNEMCKRLNPITVKTSDYVLKSEIKAKLEEIIKSLEV